MVTSLEKMMVLSRQVKKELRAVFTVQSSFFSFLAATATSAAERQYKERQRDNGQHRNQHDKCRQGFQNRCGDIGAQQNAACKQGQGRENARDPNQTTVALAAARTSAVRFAIFIQMHIYTSR